MCHAHTEIPWRAASACSGRSNCSRSWMFVQYMSRPPTERRHVHRLVCLSRCATAMPPSRLGSLAVLTSVRRSCQSWRSFCHSSHRRSATVRVSRSARNVERATALAFLRSALYTHSPLFSDSRLIFMRPAMSYSPPDMYHANGPGSRSSGHGWRK